MKQGVISVLFFDDYPNESHTFLLLLNQMAAGLGGSVVEERVVHRAEDLLRERQFDAVILDIMASRHGREDGRAGLEVLKQLRAGRYGRRNQRTPVFMRTARGDPETQSEALRNGATHYFDKGVDTDISVVAAVAKSLRQRMAAK